MAGLLLMSTGLQTYIQIQAFLQNFKTEYIPTCPTAFHGILQQKPPYTGLGC